MRKKAPKKPSLPPQRPVPGFEPKDRSIVVASKYVSMIATFISTEETRYYLTGIYIERHPVKGVIMVATDGHRMALIHDESGLFKGKGGWICPVPDDVLKACRKKPRKDMKILGAQKVHFIGKTVAVTDGKFAQEGPLDLKDGVPTGVMTLSRAEPIDGAYPQWRRILPKKKPVRETHETLAFNPNYLSDFSTVIKAAGLPESTPAVLFPAPDGSASIIRFEALPEFFGLLMGCHASPGMTVVPAWVQAERAKHVKDTKASKKEAAKKIPRKRKPK